eukprot:403351420
MEFLFDCQTLLNPDHSGIVVLDSQRDKPSGRASAKVQQLHDLIDKMGSASAKAQKLGCSITTAQKFFASDDNKLYLMVEGRQCLGLLKIGKRNLFIRNESGQMREIKPQCVLDFYVHESVQRNGIGKQLFERMLTQEKLQPHKFGYDRPSEKLLSFLSKHYYLKKYVPQANNFVVFSQYFDQAQQSSRNQTEELNQQPSKMKSFSSKTSNKEDMIREVVEKFSGLDLVGKSQNKNQNSLKSNRGQVYEEEKQWSQNGKNRNQNEKDKLQGNMRRESFSTCSNSSSEDSTSWKVGQNVEQASIQESRQSYMNNRGYNNIKNSSSGISSLLGGSNQDRMTNSKAFDYYQRKY